jgi:hypothetical protein
MKCFRSKGARGAFFLVVLLAAIPEAYGRVRFTERDKQLVVRSVLTKEDLPARHPRADEVKGVVYLSTENLSRSAAPRVRGVKLVLLAPQEIERREATGFGHLAFKEFKVGRRAVRVTLWDVWRNAGRGAGDLRKVTYEYRKVRSRWVGRRVAETFSAR